MENIILHKANRIDTGGEVKGYLTKIDGKHHIMLPNQESIAYPVKEDSISPCLKHTVIESRQYKEIPYVSLGSILKLIPCNTKIAVVHEPSEVIYRGKAGYANHSLSEYSTLCVTEITQDVIYLFLFPIHKTLCIHVSELT